MNRRWIAGTAVAVAALAAGTGQAQAGTLLASKATASKAQPQNCIKRPLPAGPGVVRRSAEAPGVGFVTATLKAARGDWDLAVFDARTRELVAGSANFGADERAQGFSTGPQSLIVQACRRSGSARTARIAVSSTALQAPSTPVTLSLVRVLIPNRERRAELTRLGLDLTEHGGRNYVEVVLHGAADAKRLREAKFQYVVQTRDLYAQALRDRRAEKRQSRRAVAAALPSGRTGTYRRLPDYNQEMKTLATQNPSLVKPLTLPLKTLTGMTVQGIEITENVKERDGKPVFLQMGVHHAREWPSAENAFEFAYELVKGYKAGDARVRRLMKSSRVIVVPIVNPEGFNTSREAGQAMGSGGGRVGNDTTETANLALFQYEYHRKNCRVNSFDPAVPDPARGDCRQLPATGLAQFGVDPNRNYGGFWGGPGAAASGEAPPGGDLAQDYRGDGPFSERESQNIRALVSARQVTTLITNHTFSNLVLRPPGIQAAGPPVDEPVYKALGDSMAVNNAYTSQPSYLLYDTTGGTEDWTYYATGGLGFTFEIGVNGFHPPYAETIAEYDGTAPAAGAGKGGNREAYFKALENTAASARHATLTGKAPAGTVLRLKKSFTTETSPVIDQNGIEGAVRTFRDTLNTTMVTPYGGDFRWGINPSTRPIAAQSKGRPATGSPSAKVNFSGTPPAAPCPDASLVNPTCYNDFAFTVPAGAGIDNAKATVDVQWNNPVTDYDITVYEDTNGDGQSAGETKVVGTSAQGQTTSETTSFGEPGERIAGKRYVVRIVNFLGGVNYTGSVTYAGPPPFKPARKESWTLTCESPSGKVGATRTITIDRGRTQKVDLEKACASVAPRLCVSTKGGIKGTGVGVARLGRTRAKQRRALQGTLLSDRKGIDRYCTKKGGALRVGYPTSRLASKLSRKTRKRIKSKAVYMGTTSKAFRLSKLKVGSSTRTLRKRLKGERRYKVGKNVWYVAKGRKARMLFRARRSKVVELSLADKRLTATKRGTVRLLRAWDKRGKTKSKAKKKAKKKG
ncbi:MAG TPA: M14 family zinc carboxypeptidase [Thermoleophilaceae bacterium]|nr:M14 family zinc carboxypeptidase [Thermoleophilaceae bacterium]